VVPENLRRLPFDHYARYQLAADVVAASHDGDQPRVLDVGGGPGSLAAFLPDALVVASDLNFPSHWHVAAPSLVLADGAALPFADRSFDVVVSLDTLEHVVPEQRTPLLRELVRVSAGWVMVACPCATPGVAEADAALLAFVRQRFGENFETVEVLTEHLAYGHPDPADVEGILTEGGAEVRRFPSGRLDRWLPMMVLFYYLMGLRRDDPVERVQAWYNALFYRDDFRDPAYRQAFLARVPGATGPGLDDVVSQLLPSGPSPAEDTTVLKALQTGLTEDLVATAEGYLGRISELEDEVERLDGELAAQAGRADAAERQVAALEAFREQVLQHPLVRVRRLAKRLVRR
jgi:SAM-dependent methyltransferase